MTWSDSATRRSTLDEIKKANLDRILSALVKSQERGLSNAELASVLGTWSQWVIREQLTKLLGLGLIQYKVELFGEAGRYMATPLGVTSLLELDWTELITNLEK